MRDDPRRLSRGRRRHHRDQHLQRDARSRRPTTGWQAASREINVAAARDRARVRRRWTREDARPAALRRRRARTDQPHRVDLAGRQRSGRAQRDASTSSSPPTPRRSTALVEGGVDLLLVETIFDTLNAQGRAVRARGRASTATDSACRSSSRARSPTRRGARCPGQTPEAFWNSVRHVRPLAVGLNCALGAALMRPYIEELARVADTYVSCYPNAGLPNPMSETGYDETPARDGAPAREFARSGFVNIVGGCCGTTPAHIRAIAEAVRAVPPRALPREASGATASLTRHALARGRGASRQWRSLPRGARRRMPRLRRPRAAQHRRRLAVRQRRRAHQRHRLARVRQADPRRRLRRRGRGRAPAGRRAARRSSTSTWTRRCSTRRRRWCAS